jgi:hypothetical protein
MREKLSVAVTAQEALDSKEKSRLTWPVAISRVMEMMRNDNNAIQSIYIIAKEDLLSPFETSLDVVPLDAQVRTIFHVV